MDILVTCGRWVRHTALTQGGIKRAASVHADAHVLVFVLSFSLSSPGIILFISLTGVPPYQLPAVSDQRFALIYNGNLAKLLAAWQMTNIMSAGAKDILSRMLCPPERRMNIQQILAHPVRRTRSDTRGRRRRWGCASLWGPLC